MRNSKLAPLSVAMLLIAVFYVIAFRFLDPLALGAGVVIISLTGFLLGRAADRGIRRHHMVIQGHAAAQIGRWGNLALLALSSMFFIFELARSIVRGDIEF